MATLAIAGALIDCCILRSAGHGTAPRTEILIFCRTIAQAAFCT